MQAYRQTSAGEPLVSMLAKRIVVLDAETGALRWEQPVEQTVAHRRRRGRRLRRR